MHLPHALGIIAEQQQIQQNVQWAPMVNVVRRNGKDPPRAKKVCRQQRQNSQQRRAQQQMPSAQASGAAVDPEVHIQTPRKAHAHGSAGADGVHEVQPEPACRAGHAVQQKADRLCRLCQQSHHQHPAEQLTSNTVFTLAAHPQQKQKAYQHRPCAIGHKDLGYIHCISSPARLIPQGRQPLFYTVSICIIYPAASCLQGLASKRAAAQQFVQRPLGKPDDPEQPSRALWFCSAEILFIIAFFRRKINSPLPARRSEF